MSTDSFSRAVPSEQFYEDMIHNAAAYNKKISHETKMRLPFLDSQTGVAQKHTLLFMPYQSRQPGVRRGQLYTYPAKRWKKKKSTVTLNEVQVAKAGDVEAGETGDVHQITTVENPVARDGHEDKAPAPQFQYSYYDDWDAMSEPDAGEIEHRDSDSSDFEETYIKKKRKKAKPKGGGRGGRKKQPTEKKEPSLHLEHKTSYDEDQEKPYSCDICNTRYKTKPGVIYHMTHHHSNVTLDDREFNASPKPPVLVPNTAIEPTGGATGGGKEGGGGEQGKYCDFCLGNERNNKKTGVSEELVSCADCGRSGHPTCLQFTANMIISVKKYPWQCIECKSCGLCGTSENDDQLLFCDDCDRGFHMYCLKPPLSEPPDGNWSCHLCIVEFYGGKKPEGME